MAIAVAGCRVRVCQLMEVLDREICENGLRPSAGAGDAELGCSVDGSSGSGSGSIGAREPDSWPDFSMQVARNYSVWGGC